jgi:putative ABC transport system permease protein
MFRNFLVSAIRNSIKQKFFTFINIAGLAIGIVTSLLIIIFVHHELSYDRFHSNAENLYRIYATGLIGETKINQVYTCAPLPETLKMEYPEVIESVRILDWGTGKVRRDSEVFNEPGIAAADSNFFDFFSFRLIKGDPKTALTKTNTMVISEKIADKYFSNQDPLNEYLKLDESSDYLITGIMENMPSNSHFHFDFILSIVSHENRLNDHWWNNNFKTYLQLQEGSDPLLTEDKFPSFIKKYLGQGNKEWDDWIEAGNNWEYHLQPITSIHLTSHLNGEFEPNGNITYVYIFLSAAILIVLVACINFMNLATSRSEKRAREVGLRKVVGSSRRLLVIQFLSESLLLSLTAMLLAATIVLFILPFFNNLSGKEFSFLDVFNGQSILWMMGAVILLGIISGLYPALFLSSFKPVSVLKGQGIRGGKSASLRGVLVIFQFIISIFLIVGTLVVYRQLQFVQNKNLGYDKDRIIVLQGTDILSEKTNVFNDQLMSYHHIQSVSSSNYIPGKGFNNWGCGVEGSDTWMTLNMLVVDRNFQETYKMQMAEGRFFSIDFPTDTSAIIINENASKLIGWDDPIGQNIYFGEDRSYKVVGVIKDFHYESLHEVIRPMGLMMLPHRWVRNPYYISIRVDGEEIQETIQYIENIWNKFSNGLPLQYSFFDEEYQELYDNEVRTGKLFMVFSALAIFIACLGLMALSAYVAEQKTKEIGIRKVNGASVRNILLLLSLNFVKWVLIAFVISSPITWLIMKNWLENFQYRISMDGWVFVIGGITALIIALLTISFQSIKAAIKNPVEALRYE